MSINDNSKLKSSFLYKYNEDEHLNDKKEEFESPKPKKLNFFELENNSVTESRNFASSNGNSIKTYHNEKLYRPNSSNISSNLFPNDTWESKGLSEFTPTVIEIDNFHHTKTISEKAWKRMLHIPRIDNNVHHNADKAFSIYFNETMNDLSNKVNEKKKLDKQEDQEMRNRFSNFVKDKHKKKMEDEILKRELFRKKMEKIKLYHANTNYREIQNQRRKTVAEKLKPAPTKFELKPASDRLVDSLQELDFTDPIVNAKIESELSSLFENYNERKSQK